MDNTDKIFSCIEDGQRFGRQVILQTSYKCRRFFRFKNLHPNMKNSYPDRLFVDNLGCYVAQRWKMLKTETEVFFKKKRVKNKLRV